MSSIADQVHGLMNEFEQEDDKRKRLTEWLESLPEDKLMEALKEFNPHGPVLPDQSDDNENGPQAILSYTNLRWEFARKFAMVGLVAFVQRMLKEYKVPEEVPPVDPEDYIKDPSVLDTPANITDPRAIQKWAEARETMSERVVIWNFFKSIFDFDPDRHVTSALQTNTKDPNRKAPDTPAVRRAVTGKKNTVRPVPRAEYEAKPEDLTPADTTLTGEVEKAAFATIPPLDTFERWNRYSDEHYEELLKTTQAVYGCVPDVELLVNVYEVCPTREAANKFKDQHQDEFKASVVILRKNRWAILGPYRQNRESVDFLNRHTEVLKEMIDQRERDSHIAKDVMNKRVKSKKAQNIKEAGPDDKAFRRWARKNKPEVAKMGGEHIGQDDDSDSCPEDAVEVNVFKMDKGGRETKVYKIYNPKDTEEDVARMVGDDAQRVNPTKK